MNVTDTHSYSKFSGGVDILDRVACPSQSAACGAIGSDMLTRMPGRTGGVPQVPARAARRL